MYASDPVIMIVGTKLDLEKERKVSKEKGKTLGVERGLLMIETSSKSGENVKEAFKMIVRECHNKFKHTKFNLGERY